MTYSKKQENILIFIFFTLLFVLYFFTSFDKVSFGDCIGYINTVEEGKYILRANSVDHFLYTNGLILFNKVSMLETILSVKIFNSFFAIIALYYVYKFIKLMFYSTKLSVLATIIFAFSFTFWRMSSTIEVCSFNSVFLGAFLYYSLLFVKTKKISSLHLASWILGLSFWVHVQNIMIIPSLVYLYCIAYKNIGNSVYKSIASFLIPSLLLFVPALITGDDLRNVYGSTNTKWVTGTFTKSIRQYLKDIAIALGYFIYNFWYFILPGLFGIYHRFRRPSQLNIFLAIGFLIPFAFGTFYNVSDNYVYFIGPYQIFLIYVVDGLVQFSKKYNKTLVISSVLALMMPLMYVISYQIVLKTPQGQAFHQFKKYKGGLNYYLYPWMNNNVGVLEFTIEKRPSPEDIYWMKTVSRWFIENRMKKGDTLEEIKGM